MSNKKTCTGAKLPAKTSTAQPREWLTLLLKTPYLSTWFLEHCDAQTIASLAQVNKAGCDAFRRLDPLHVKSLYVCSILMAIAERNEQPDEMELNLIDKNGRIIRSGTPYVIVTIGEENTVHSLHESLKSVCWCKSDGCVDYASFPSLPYCQAKPDDYYCLDAVPSLVFDYDCSYTNKADLEEGKQYHPAKCMVCGEPCELLYQGRPVKNASGVASYCWPCLDKRPVAFARMLAHFNVGYDDCNNYSFIEEPCDGFQSLVSEHTHDHEREKTTETDKEDANCATCDTFTQLIGSSLSELDSGSESEERRQYHSIGLAKHSGMCYLQTWFIFSKTFEQ